MSTRQADHARRSPAPIVRQSAPVEPALDPADIADDVVLFDTERLRRFGRRSRTACRRHPFSAATGVVVVVAAASLSWLAAPFSYESSGVVSARSDVVSSAIANPARSVPPGTDRPLANATETVLSETNIDRIIDQAGLIGRVNAGETVLGRTRRHALEAIGVGGGDVDSAAIRDSLRRQLREALVVQIDGGSNGPDRITISVSWPEADDAVAIVTAAQANFLEDRHIADLGPIEDAVTILERYSADADAEAERLRNELDFPLTDERDIPHGSPLRAALERRTELSDRLNGAKIELDAAEVAFKYRYSVVQTPEQPQGPLKTIVVRVGITAVLAVLAGGGLALVRDAGRQKRSRAGHEVETEADDTDGNADPASPAVASRVSAAKEATTEVVEPDTEADTVVDAAGPDPDVDPDPSYDETDDVAALAAYLQAGEDGPVDVKARDLAVTATGGAVPHRSTSSLRNALQPIRSGSSKTLR